MPRIDGAITKAAALALVLTAEYVSSAPIAGGDVLARCQSIVAATSGTSTATVVAIDETKVPTEIRAVLTAKGVKWDSLSDPMRIGLLWAYGYVLSSTQDGVSSNPPAVVYTDCSSESSASFGRNEDTRGVAMNAIEISFEAFKESCAVNTCGDGQFYKSDSTQCTPALEKSIQCAINSQDVPSSGGSFWSNASASDSTIPKPFIFTQQVSIEQDLSGGDSSKSGSVGSSVGSNSSSDDGFSVVTIQMSSVDTSVTCGSSDDAIIPCLALETVTDRKFCRPKVDEAAVNAFLDVIAPKVTGEVTSGSNGDSESSGLSTGAIIGIIGGALVVLGLVAFYFFRNGRKPASRKNSNIGEPTYTGFGNKLTGGHGDGRRPGFDRTNTGNLAVMGPERDNDTVNSTDAYGGAGSIVTDSLRAPGGRPFNPLITSEGSDRPRVSSSSRGGPYGKTTEDYMEESEILREFLTDPHILMRRIAHEELTTLRILSKGSYGEVYLGQLETRHVAMKRLLPEKKHLIRSIEQFTGEIRLMTNLEHRNIVSFIGVSWDHVPNICAVVEYMDNGDLAEVLAKSKGKLTWPKEKISIAMDVAEGLVYLHSMRPVIVHRDLKSKNVLLNKRGQAKLSDFGVSRKTTVNETMTSGVGTLLWTAPEIIEGRKYSEKADIFSLGVVLSEIDTGEEPYASMKNDNNNERLPGMQIVQMVRLGELKVRFRDDCPPKIRELAEQCTSLDPDMRPTSMEVAYTLKSIIAPMLRR